jgi:hypothetical protein
MTDNTAITRLSDMKSQHEIIIKHFTKHKKPLTSQAAWDNYGISKLSTRISELFSRGYPVKKRWIYTKDRYGSAIRVIQYSLAI